MASREGVSMSLLIWVPFNMIDLTYVFHVAKLRGLSPIMDR